MNGFFIEIVNEVMFEKKIYVDDDVILFIEKMFFLFLNGNLKLIRENCIKIILYNI